MHVRLREKISFVDAAAAGGGADDICGGDEENEKVATS